MLGQRVARKLAGRGCSLLLSDLMPPPESLPAGATVITGPLQAEMIDQIITPSTTAVVHLAAVVSSEAEANFDLGWDVNIGSLRLMLERCRALGTKPKFVYASSTAAFGPSQCVEDDTPTRPMSSYGAQKAIGEYYVNDYSRKGFIDGLSLRLPTVVIRPGTPNKASTGFFSGILREPLAGRRAVCPVPTSAATWMNSPESVTAAIVHAALDLPTDTCGPAGWRSVTLPGVTVSVGEMITALERAGGDSSLIAHERNPSIEAIVSTIPYHFLARGAEAMGFPPADSLEDIIHNHRREHELL